MKKRGWQSAAMAGILMGAMLLTTACGGGGSTASTASSDSGQSAAASTAAESTLTDSTAADAAESTGADSAAEKIEAAESSTNPISVTDMTGRMVTLDGPASRVVALTASDCEILYALGAGDTLVGRGEYCDYPAEVFDVPSVQSGSETNIEEILALEPQVLFMGTMAQTEEQVKALEDAGVKVVVSEATDINGVYDSIKIIGALMGKDAEAEALVTGMQDSFSELSSHAAENEGKSVYFEVSPLEWGLWSAGKNTFMDEVAQILGLKNIFDDMDGWCEVSEEAVLERNPDYIVTISMYFGEGPTPEEEIASRAGWENVTAVQNGAILNLPNNELSRPVPRLVDGAQMLEDFILAHPAEALQPAA